MCRALRRIGLRRRTGLGRPARRIRGVGGGADGAGGVGAGGADGQFRKALVIVKFADGSELGRALTDDERGMVTIRPGPTYQGALLVEIHGQPGATYFEEGKNSYVPFETGRITFKALDYYISEEVNKMTEGRQTPVTISPLGVPDFAIARVGN